MINEGKSNEERTKTITLPKLRITLQHMVFLRSTCHLCNKAHLLHPILLTLQFMNCLRRRHHRLQKTIQLRIESAREIALSMRLQLLLSLPLKSLSAQQGKWMLMKTTMMTEMKIKRVA
jgi:hypothetical protein